MLLRFSSFDKYFNIRRNIHFCTTPDDHLDAVSWLGRQYSCISSRVLRHCNVLYMLVPTYCNYYVLTAYLQMSWYSSGPLIS